MKGKTTHGFPVYRNNYLSSRDISSPLQASILPYSEDLVYSITTHLRMKFLAAILALPLLVAGDLAPPGWSCATSKHLISTMNSPTVNDIRHQSNGCKLLPLRSLNSVPSQFMTTIQGTVYDRGCKNLVPYTSMDPCPGSPFVCSPGTPDIIEFEGS